MAEGKGGGASARMMGVLDGWGGGLVGAGRAVASGMWHEGWRVKIVAAMWLKL